jgi:hypothetical protein
MIFNDDRNRCPFSRVPFFQLTETMRAVIQRVTKASVTGKAV